MQVAGTSTFARRRPISRPARQWGLFGDPRVNVLETNVVLDRELPKRGSVGKVAAAPSAP